MIQPVLHQDVADPYPDLRRFLDAIYEKANLAAANFNQRDIVTRCIDAFVANGLEDEQRIVDACEVINSDDLSLKAAKVPILLIAMIYKTILEFRKKAPNQVCCIVRIFLKCITCTYELRMYGIFSTIIGRSSSGNRGPFFYSQAGRRLHSSIHLLVADQSDICLQPQQQSAASSTQLTISAKDAITSSGNSWVVDGIFTV